MTTTTFSLKGWIDWLGELDTKMEQAMNRGLESGALRAIPMLHAATNEARPASPRGTYGAVDTGAYRAAWKSESIPHGVRIFNDRPYSPVIEGGRRKGTKMPPARPIEQWAMRKLGLSQEEAKAASYVMRRAIKDRGLQVRSVLKRALPDVKEAVIEEMMYEITKELNTR